VEDSGPGVPADLRPALFEPFSKGKRGKYAPGLGIGLSLVARFAKLHGGRAWVEDRPGGGASFRVHIPNASPAPIEVEPVEVGSDEPDSITLPEARLSRAAADG